MIFKFDSKAGLLLFLILVLAGAVVIFIEREAEDIGDWVALVLGAFIISRVADRVLSGRRTGTNAGHRSSGVDGKDSDHSLNGDSPADQVRELERLNLLRKDGAISEEEFQKLKNRILN